MSNTELNNSEVVEFLTKKSIREFPLCEGNTHIGFIAELLIEGGEVVKKEIFDTRRWYQIWEYVAEFDGKFIKYRNIVMTGDGDIDDVEYCPLDHAHFVTKKTKMVEVDFYE